MASDGALLGIVAVGRGLPPGVHPRLPTVCRGPRRGREREPRRPLAESHAPLAELLRGLIEPLSTYRTVERAYDDAVWVSYRLTEVLPLALPLKQELLEMTDSHARLDRIAVSLPPPSRG